jgi:lipopolysaccharide heptosyltransferase I
MGVATNRIGQYDCAALEAVMSQLRILITRLSAIGDAILTLPVLCALRDHFPDAFLAWAAEPGPAAVLRGHACLDELIVVPKGWLKSPRLAWELRSQLRARRFDVTIDPQSLTKSSALAWLSGAQRRLGFARPRGRELSVWFNNELCQPTHTHPGDCQLELLQLLDVRPRDVRFAVPDDPGARAAVEAFLGQSGLDRGFAVINPGASWDSKLWPAERFSQVAAHLGAGGVPAVVVWAGQREAQWAQQIVAGANGHAVLAPATTLPELAALLRRARLYVGSDTGPMHLSAAVGTPCVALFGTTRPEDSGPYGAGHVTIQEYYQAGTSRARRKAANDAMQAISVGRVCEACDQVLARGSGHAA